MPRLTQQAPKYCKHKASGQAVVTLSRRQFYLGPHGTRASRREYDRHLAEWMANGRALSAETDILTFNEVAIRFWRHATVYYVKNGRPTSEQGEYRLTLKIARALYGREPVSDFTPARLKAIREKMLTEEWCRYTINRRIGRIVRVFKWGVVEGLVPLETYQALTTVEGLKKGRSKARESEPVRPVSLEDVEKTLPHLQRTVADMVRVAY